MNLEFPIITGSDCHEWQAYPYHDKKNNTFDIDFTKFKCLPTFKGLVMSITSFKTRVNRTMNDNCYIKSVSINGNIIPLSNSINVIIGDNGSGKSLIASILAKQDKKIYKALIKSNAINPEFDPQLLNNEILFIEQGQIIDKANKGKLFNDPSFYNNISTIKTFETRITNYANAICLYVERNINANKLFDKLSKEYLTLESFNNDFYYPIIDEDIDFDDDNIDYIRLTKIDEIITNVKDEWENNNEYYKNNEIDIKILEVQKHLSEIRNLINDIYNIKKFNNYVKKIIQDKFKDLKIKTDERISSLEKTKRNTIEIRNNFKKIIINCIKSNFTDNTYPKFPEKLPGCSSKTKNGFNFRKVAKFDELDLKDEFYNFCFNKEYQNEEAIKKIKNEGDFSNALSGYKYSQFNEFKTNKINKFIENYSEEKTEILKSSFSETIGHTPGELSLVYYEYTFNQKDPEWKVLIIDQPEDNINPSKIISCLNKYLGALRDKKQIIIITHNPLLVVNLDVDNVIYVKKLNDKKIEVLSGALEFSNDNYSILNLIKNNLDGGYDAIERRLKVYDNN